MLMPATPFTTCANGCGIPAKWKVKKNGRTKNLRNQVARSIKARENKIKIPCREQQKG